MDWNPLNWGKTAVRGTTGFLGAINPLDPRNTQRAGRALGNLISQNRRAESVVNTIGRRGGSAVAGAVRDLTGVGGFQRATTQAQQGNIGAALRAAAGGALNLGLSASGIGRAAGLTGRFATQGAYQAARAAGRGVAPSVARAAGTAVFGDPASAALRRAAAGRGAVTRGAAAATGLLLPGSTFERAVVNPLVNRTFDRYLGTGGRATPTRGTTYTDSEGRVNTWNSRTGMYEVTGFRPQSSKAPYYSREGFYNVFNPRTGIYEVVSNYRPTTGVAGTRVTGPGAAGEDIVYPTSPGTTVVDQGGPAVVGELIPGAGAFPEVVSGGGPGGGYSPELGALSPEEMQQLLEASRQAQREYDEILNRIGRTTAETERELFDYIRGVNRQVAGGRQTTASQLAQLGMETSPATQAYAEYLGAQGQRQIAGGRANVAKILSDLREERGAAEAEKLRRMRELDVAMRNARARRTVDQYQY